MKKGMLSGKLSGKGEKKGAKDIKLGNGANKLDYRKGNKK